MIGKIGALGFVLALAHAQSSDDNSSISTGSQAPTSTPGPQAAVENDAQSRQLFESSSEAGSFTYVPTTTSSASFSFDPTQQSSWTYMPTTTPNASWTYIPTSAESSPATPESILSRSEQPSFVFAPSSTTATTTEAMASVSPTNTIQSTDIRPVQETSVTTIMSGSSSVMSESSPETGMGTVETVQTIHGRAELSDRHWQTQSELMAPTFSSNYTWAPTTTTAMGIPLFPTGVVYAPHVEHLGSTLQGPQATTGPGSSIPGNSQQSAALPVYEAPQSPSGNADTSLDVQQSPSSAHGSNAPPAVPAYHNEPAPTTLVTATCTASIPGETAASPAIMQGIGGVSPAAQASATTTLPPAAFMSIMAGIFPLGGYTSPETVVAGAGSSSPSVAPANAMPTTKTVQMSGMTLTAEPTSTGGNQVGGNSLAATGASQTRPALANDAAGAVSVRRPFIMAAVAIGALTIM